MQREGAGGWEGERENEMGRKATESDTESWATGAPFTTGAYHMTAARTSKESTPVSIEFGRKAEIVCSLFGEEASSNTMGLLSRCSALH